MEGNKFDPMTGEPIVRETVQETVNSVNDAAATAANNFAGAATTAANDFAGAAQTTAAQAEQAVYDTTPVEPQKKGGKGKLIAIIAGAVVLVAAIACLVIFVLLPMFGKPTKKIFTAAENTFSKLNKGENKLMSALLPAGMENADTFTLSVDGSIYDEYSDAEYTGDISFIKTADALQIAGGVDLGDLMDLPYIDVQFLIDKKSIQLASSLLQNKYIYNYTKEPDGYIADILEESGMEAEDLNDMIKDLYKTMMDTEGMKKINDDLYAEWQKVFHDLDVEKIDAAEFEINGKDVKCQGYKVKITSKDMKKFMDSYKKSMKGLYEGSFSSVLAMADMDVDDLMDEMFGDTEEMFEDMEDIELDFYIYQNALAAIETEIEDEKLSIQFQGGDYRAQNILVESDEFSAAINGEIDGNKETMSVTVDDEEYFSYEFDSKKGDLTFTVNDGYDEYEIEGINIKSEDDEVVISLDEFAPADSEIEINGTITYKKAAKIKEMSGDEFDIGSADEDELEEVVEEESEAFEELGLY